MKRSILSVFLLALLACASLLVVMSPVSAQFQPPGGSVGGGYNPDSVTLIPTAYSESGNVVTITVPNTSTVVGVGQSFTISGATPSGYNGNYVALTASTTTITALNATGSLGAGTVFGVLQTPAIGPSGLATASGLVVTIAPGPIYCLGGDMNLIIKQTFTVAANTTYYNYYRCPTSQLLTSTTPPVPSIDILLNTIVAGASTVTLTDNRQGNSQAFPPTVDFVWNVPLHDCTLGVPNTGALAAASTVGENVGIVWAAAGNPVLQLKTTAAANIPVLDCDITPMLRSQGSRGLTINQIEEMYGYQTTAPTSIDLPTLQTVLGATSGNATAAGTVAAVGGTLVQNVGTSHSTPAAVTTTGTCFTEDTVPTTPVLMTNPLMRLTWEHTFHQTAAAATILQICGLKVYGSFIQ